MHLRTSKKIKLCWKAEMPDALLMQNYVMLSWFNIDLLLHFELFVAYIDNTWLVQNIVNIIA
jgi:hypothetical protein